VTVVIYNLRKAVLSSKGMHLVKCDKKNNFYAIECTIPICSMHKADAVSLFWTSYCFVLSYCLNRVQHM